MLIINGWADKLSKYGNKDIWAADKNFKDFESAYAKIRGIQVDKDVEIVLSICKRLKDEGCALEQETAFFKELEHQRK